MPPKDTDPASKGAVTPSASTPGPDAMLGLWSSWMKAQAGAEEDWFISGKHWWQIAREALTSALAEGVTSLGETFGKDPLLTSIDQAWNANPLRKVIPVDWAEIARSLR